MYSSVALSIHDVTITTYIHLENFFIILSRNSVPIKQQQLSCPLPPRYWQPPFYLLSMNLPILVTSCKSNHTILSIKG